MSDPADTSPLYVLPHIPKTAGQSLRTHLQHTMPDAQEAIGVINQHPDHQGPELTELASRGARLKLITGHRATRALVSHFPGREIRWVTLLREPKSYMVSRFNYSERNAELTGAAARIAFRKWSASHSNGQTRWLLSVFAGHDLAKMHAAGQAAMEARAAEILADFWCIGRVEDIGGTLARFFTAIGASTDFSTHRNVSGLDYPKRLKLTPEIAEMLVPLTRIDQALYDRFSQNAPV